LTSACRARESLAEHLIFEAEPRIEVFNDGSVLLRRHRRLFGILAQLDGETPGPRHPLDLPTGIDQTRVHQVDRSDEQARNLLYPGEQVFGMIYDIDTVAPP